MSPQQRSVPDLLRRFVATPLVLLLSTGRFETNDPELFAAVQNSNILEYLSRAKAPYSVKLVRDADAPWGGSNKTLLSRGWVRTVAIGMGTIAWVDAERHEIFGFVAPDVSSMQVITELLPLAVKLLPQQIELAELD